MPNFMKNLENINQSWKWKKFTAIEIIKINDFGNVIFKTFEGEYWRICPEELSCEKIAKNENEFISATSEIEFIEDWEMKNLVKIAENKLGKLELSQKYCLKMPAPIGGKYDESNFEKIDFSELISFSGDLARQIKDLKDGDNIKIEIQN